MPIQLLDPGVAAKIAAGEVIERPASVIKELMDNCIDAGANEIRIEIRGGGQSFMRISDNGGGIVADDLPLAFVRHATSKIKTAEELFALHTLGFRGEALASVSAVARVTISSRVKGQEAGAEMTVEGGQPGTVNPRGMPRGTIVTVRDLFFNVPARLKFLKSAAAESAHISSIVQQYVLAYPTIKFVLISEGKQVISSPGTGDQRDAIRQVYGQEVAGVMLPVGEAPTSEKPNDDPFADWLEPSEGQEAAPQLAEPEPLAYQVQKRNSEADQPVAVWGFISPPAVSRTNRQAQHFFVNGRTIGSRMLTFALEEAYHSLLMVGRHPIAVLNIQVDPAEVDANVHPTKSEVKFRQERAVFAAVQRAVRHALSEHPTVPTFGTRGAEGWQVSRPEQDQAQDGDGAEPTENSYRPSFAAPDGSNAAPSQRQIFPEYESPALVWTAPATNGDAPHTLSDEPERGEEEDADGWSDLQRAPRSNGADPLPALPPLPPLPSGNRLPPLRVVGQVSNTYIIAEGPDGMFLIDQHAAHERVLYEKLDREMRNSSVPVQGMLQPLTLDLTARQRAEVEPVLALLQEVGFDAELVKGRENALLIKAVPAMYNSRELRDDMLEMLDELVVGSPPDRWRDQLAITLACHSAIRAGKVLSSDEMKALVNQLESCTFPRLCAHGRPTLLHLSALQLEREFGRRG